MIVNSRLAFISISTAVCDGFSDLIVVYAISGV